MAAELEVKQNNWIESTRSYLADIRSEMKRVTWPTKDRVQSTTMIVILSVFVFAAYFKVVDWVIQNTVVRASDLLLK